MKKLFLLLLPGMMLLAGSAEAQFQKGVKYWGATINFRGEFSRHTDEYDGLDMRKTSNPTVTPEAQLGWFVSGKTMLGVGLKYSLNYQKDDQSPLDYEVRAFNQSLQLLPFIRQYYTLNDRWSIFIHGELGPAYSWSKTKNGGLVPSTSKSDYWQYGLNVKPGVVYTFPNKKWSLEAYTNFLALNFNYLPSRPDADRQFNFRTGLTTDFPSYFSLRIARYIQPKN
ncbi:Opacity protein [Dyadobacter sp. SG02]|uniref:outer membrane beta-barrel protein n=1 Tax=Dyadobacter sp. SG02 TaxID=1855291 RepID=UPI0008C42DE0|nr:outer membrane beta-barrel protein [Dyadobacter sp. SG02]SEI44019.1 Opacity protein [Dyadobacter sp. SG02]